MARDGWNPRIIEEEYNYCSDSPLSIVHENGVNIPEIEKEKGTYIPYSVLNHNPTIVIEAIDDSMKEACISKGDQLTVRCGLQPFDCDIMLAEVNGQTVVHAYYEDYHKWLIATNENTKPILLTEDLDVQWIGKVIKVEKLMPRISLNDCKRILAKSKVLQFQKPMISQERQKHAIVMIATLITKRRQWYSVYRAMLDAKCDLVYENNFASFCELVKKEVPYHSFLPTDQELQRMAVASFAKPVKHWDENNAPVKGKRFKDYLYIAECMAGLLVNQNSPETL